MRYKTVLWDLDGTLLNTLTDLVNSVNHALTVCGLPTVDAQQVSAGTGNGVLEGAKEAGHFAIGVDLNQDADQPGAVFTSMVKRVDNACYFLIQSVVEGNFAGGTTEYLDLAKGGVSLTDMSVIKEALGDQFPAEIPEKIAELNDKIISGEIVVENYEGFGPAK